MNTSFSAQWGTVSLTEQTLLPRSFHRRRMMRSFTRWWCASPARAVRFSYPVIHPVFVSKQTSVPLYEGLCTAYQVFRVGLRRSNNCTSGRIGLAIRERTWQLAILMPICLGKSDWSSKRIWRRMIDFQKWFTEEWLIFKNDFQKNDWFSKMIYRRMVDFQKDLQKNDWFSKMICRRMIDFQKWSAEEWVICKNDFQKNDWFSKQS
jgi:endogenous inhibitor of DNA gyrase (YacG/DUF329 family)